MVSRPSPRSLPLPAGLKQARISYKLTLRVDLPDETRTFLKESADVYLNARIVPSPQHRQSEGNIVQLLCFNRGTVELQVKLDKNNFSPGEKLQLEYTLDNTRCQRAVERVQARILNKLTFIDDDEVERLVE